MKTRGITPVDEPRDFEVHELFFSATDRKGVIRSGNDVFMRVSGYASDEMVGRPHNIVRHPDLPRAIFRLLWSYLLQGRAMAGYVKNMTSDGRYYWVVAVVTPVETGFLSVRFKPSGRLFGFAQSLYAEMRRIEQQAATEGVDGNTAMDRATDHLLSALQAEGFPDYEAFMATLVTEELTGRDDWIARERRVLVPEHLAAAPHHRALETIYRQCLAAYRQLDALYTGLVHFLPIDRELRAGFTEVTGLAGSIRLVALNATIKAASLGGDGHCTAVVAEFLADTSGSIAQTCAAFERQLQPVAQDLRAASFNLAAARLQLEMILLFCQELARLGHLEGTHGRDLDTLQTAFNGTIGPAVRALRSVEQTLLGFRGHSETFSQLTLNLQVSQTVGAIEASRLAHDIGLKQTFEDLRRLTDGCRTETTRLETALGRFDAFAVNSPAMIDEIHAAIDATRRSVKAFVDLLNRSRPAPAARGPGCPRGKSGARPDRRLTDLRAIRGPFHRRNSSGQKAPPTGFAGACPQAIRHGPRPVRSCVIRRCVQCSAQPTSP